MGLKVPSSDDFSLDKAINVKIVVTREQAITLHISELTLYTQGLESPCLVEHLHKLREGILPVAGTLI